MYLMRRVTRVKLRAISVDCKPEFFVTTNSKEIRIEHEVMSRNRTEILNCWGYGLEIPLSIAEEDFKELYCIFCKGKQTEYSYREKIPLFVTEVTI